MIVQIMHVLFKASIYLYYVTFTVRFLFSIEFYAEQKFDYHLEFFVQNFYF